MSFDQAIIAAGSEPVTLPFIPHDDPRVIDSTGALELGGIPKRLLVLGGGIIGLEMATVYHELGSKVTIVELMDQIIPGADKDIVTPLIKRIAKRYENIYLKTKVTKVEASRRRAGASASRAARRRRPTRSTASWSRSGGGPTASVIGAENAGVLVDERGFIPVDKQQRTNVPHIFAIGDVVGQPMLAHKAVHEGKVAAEVAAGLQQLLRRQGDPVGGLHRPRGRLGRASPRTRPRPRASSTARGCSPGRRPAGRWRWAATRASPRCCSTRPTDRIIGCGIVGPSAGDLIAEAALAIEMGADAADIGLTIHPHPTLSETVGMAAEAFEGTITDLYLPKKKKKTT